MKRIRNDTTDSKKDGNPSVPSSMGAGDDHHHVSENGLPTGDLSQDDVVTIEEKLRKLQHDYSLAVSELARARKEYGRLLKKCEPLQMLLSAFCTLEDAADGHIVVPVKGTPYWYVRATFGRSYFDVCQCNWIGGLSDKFRYCRGNFFLDEQTANHVCNSCNALIAKI